MFDSAWGSRFIGMLGESGIETLACTEESAVQGETCCFSLDVRGMHLRRTYMLSDAQQTYGASRHGAFESFALLWEEVLQWK